MPLCSASNPIFISSFFSLKYINVGILYKSFLKLINLISLLFPFEIEISQFVSPKSNPRHKGKSELINIISSLFIFIIEGFLFILTNTFAFSLILFWIIFCLFCLLNKDDQITI